MIYSRYRELAALLCITAVFLALVPKPAGAEYEHLAEAIRLYEKGDLDGAFEQTSLQMEATGNCAPVYYYRALIRAKTGDFRRAAISLNAAFRDSTGYWDAYGLEAVIERAEGNGDQAVQAWRIFLKGQGLSDNKETALDDIMYPDEFHAAQEVTADSGVELTALPEPAEEPQPQQEIPAGMDTPAQTTDTALSVETAPEPEQAEPSAPAAETAVEEPAAATDPLENAEFPMAVTDYVDLTKPPAPAPVPTRDAVSLFMHLHNTLTKQQKTIIPLSILLVLLLALKGLKFVVGKQDEAADLHELVSDAEAMKTVAEKAKPKKKRKNKPELELALGMKEARKANASEIHRLMKKV